jgi:hypothetical protein
MYCLTSPASPFTYCLPCLDQFIFLQEDQEDNRLEDQPSNYSALASLKFSFIGHIACYFVAFYFAFLFSDEYQKALQSCCFIAALISLPVPVFYYLKNKDNLQREFVEDHQKLTYTNLSGDNRMHLEEEEEEVKEIVAATAVTEISVIGVVKKYMPTAASLFIQSSLAVNLSYSTLWIMDGLIKKSVK